MLGDYMEVFRFDMHRVRTTNECPRRVSIFDVIKAVTGKENASWAWTQLQQRYVDITDSDVYKFPGGRHRATPVTDARGLVTIINLLPGRKAAEFRTASAEVLVRYLGGDETLVSDIKRNKAEQVDLPESSPAKIFGEAVTERLKSATGVIDFMSPQVYMGLPLGLFQDLRPKGNPPPPEVDLSTAIICKTGSQLSEGRIHGHSGTYGGFELLESCCTPSCNFFEKEWKNTLRNMGRLLKGKHTSKDTEDHELFWILGQDDYEQNIIPEWNKLIAKARGVDMEKEITLRKQSEEATKQAEAGLRVEEHRTRQLELQLEIARLQQGIEVQHEPQPEQVEEMQVDAPIEPTAPGPQETLLVTFTLKKLGNAQKVEQRDMRGRYIRAWDSAAAAVAALKCPPAHISSCLKGHRNQAGGFRWTKDTTSLFSVTVPYTDHERYVQQSPEGVFVNSYRTLMEAAKRCHTYVKSLRHAIATGDDLQGYVWTDAFQHSPGLVES